MSTGVYIILFGIIFNLSYKYLTYVCTYIDNLQLIGLFRNKGRIRLEILFGRPLQYVTELLKQPRYS